MRKTIASVLMLGCLAGCEKPQTSTNLAFNLHHEDSETTWNKDFVILQCEHDIEFVKDYDSRVKLEAELAKFVREGYDRGFTSSKSEHDRYLTQCRSTSDRWDTRIDQHNKIPNVCRQLEHISCEPIIALFEQNMEPPSVLAEQIASDYRSNELAAESKYKGRRFRISGWVSSVSKDILKDTYVWLNDHRLYAAVINNDGVYGLSRGQAITMDCEVGSGVFSVPLKNCTLGVATVTF